MLALPLGIDLSGDQDDDDEDDEGEGGSGGGAPSAPGCRFDPALCIRRGHVHLTRQWLASLEQNALSGSAEGDPFLAAEARARTRKKPPFFSFFPPVQCMPWSMSKRFFFLPSPCHNTSHKTSSSP